MNRGINGKLGELSVCKALLENGITNLFVPLNPTQSQCDIIALSNDYNNHIKIEVKYIDTNSSSTNFAIDISNDNNFKFDFLIVCISDNGKNTFWIITRDELSKNKEGKKIQYSITKKGKYQIYMKRYINSELKTLFVDKWEKLELICK